MRQSLISVVLAASAALSLCAAQVAEAVPVVPAYSSLPSATATLYLDMDGVTYPGNWGGKTPGTVPAYDTNGNADSFSQTELNNIRQVWSRVAEMYSPFNINVTTADPGVYRQREAVRVVIGGNNAWYGSGGGVAYGGGFTSASSNLQNHTGWVFEDNLFTPFNVAAAAAHEAGHTFGLSHQSRFNGNNKTDDYRGSTDGGYTAPIMGFSYQGSTANLPRNVWSNGPRAVGGDQHPVQQLDLAVLASTNANRSPNNAGYYNGFGFRADDHANTAAGATLLNVNGPKSVGGSGIITQNTDRDFFKFSSTGGGVTVAADGAEFGQMLDILLELYDSSLTLLGSYDPALNKNVSSGFGLDASYTGILAAGDYFVDVTSHGGYGDIGQYTLNVSGAVAVPEPAALALAGLGGLALLRRRRR